MRYILLAIALCFSGYLAGKGVADHWYSKHPVRIVPEPFVCDGQLWMWIERNTWKSESGTYKIEVQ